MQRYCYRFKDNGALYEHVGKDSRLQSRTVNIWGCFFISGPQLIRRIDGRLDAKKFIGLLEEISSLIDCSHPFVHDYNSVNRSRFVKQWFDNQSLLNPLPWPHSSSDLNPMTEIWRTFLQECNARNSIVSNPEELWKEMEDCWEKLKTQELFQLIIQNAIGCLSWNLTTLLIKANKFP